MAIYWSDPLRPQLHNASSLKMYAKDCPKIRPYFPLCSPAKIKQCPVTMYLTDVTFLDNQAWPPELYCKPLLPIHITIIRLQATSYIKARAYLTIFWVISWFVTMTCNSYKKNIEMLCHLVQRSMISSLTLLSKFNFCQNISPQLFRNSLNNQSLRLITYNSNWKAYQRCASLVCQKTLYNQLYHLISRLY